MSNIYLERYAYPKTYLDQADFGNPDLIVVIPCHDEPDLIASLNALECCEHPNCNVAIITVINAGENSSGTIKANNLRTFELAHSWAKQDRRFSYYFILENELPNKHAGVGLARKIGMDEAVKVFEKNLKDGVILCYDADSLCEPNLLSEVTKLFSGDPKIPGCSIHFEHPLEGEFEEEIYQGITNYELHLRYYIDGLKYAGFPYAFQTIGSSMAVRSSAYQKQGGMNRRKAGEDFYFLHRIIPLGNFSNLNTTKIIPSPRKSDRVPFGTGKAIGDWLNNDLNEYWSYDFRVFEDLKTFIDTNSVLFELPNDGLTNHYHSYPQSIKAYMCFAEFEHKIEEFHQYSSNWESFYKRFWQWFDGFKVLKYVHYARDHFYQNQPISQGIHWLFSKYGEPAPDDLKLSLFKLRALNKNEIIPTIPLRP